MTPVKHPRALAALALLPVLGGCHHARVAYNPAANAPAPPDTSRPGIAADRTVGSVPPAPARRMGGAPAGEASHAAISPLASPVLAPRGKPAIVENGLASWYGPPYHNRQAADGSIFDQNALTAAHRTLPLGTVVRVTNTATGESVVARITDRGPFIPGRTLDLSLAAAKAIGVYRAGVAPVQVEAWPTPGADPVGRWCVQIGVFIDPADAVQLRNDLSGRYGARARVIEFAGPTGHWVRINPVASADEPTAEKIAASIHLPDATPYVVRLN